MTRMESQLLTHVRRILKAFLANIKGDSNLPDKLKAFKTPEDIAIIAKEHGHEFSADKIIELSEEN